MTRTRPRHRLRQMVLLGTAGLFVLCLAPAGLSALSNLTLPSGPAVLDRLDALDKARLQETLHLKQALGEAVWPGWGQAHIPVIVWNREYAFLIGAVDPPAEWAPVPGDEWQGRPYYRQPAHNPQNFAVAVGDSWAGSIGTKSEMDTFLIEQFRRMMPGPLKAVFPYRLLIQPSEVHITGVLHESFHAYVAETNPARLEAAEEAHRLEDQYWRADDSMRDDWRAEIDLLARAVRAESDAEAADLARQFLEARHARRQSRQLAALVDYECQLEWEEGLAKYVELSIWREAANSTEYEPLASLADDPDFKHYRTFSQHLSQELGQMTRQASQEGEVRFYYTGMAQAILLDRLMPGWKAGALADDVQLEDLLREAVGTR